MNNKKDFTAQNIFQSILKLSSESRGLITFCVHDSEILRLKILLNLRVISELFLKLIFHGKIETDVAKNVLGTSKGVAHQFFKCFKKQFLIFV